MKIQIRWTDETEWKTLDRTQWGREYEAHDPVDAVKRSFATTKKKYDLKYDMDVRIVD